MAKSNRNLRIIEKSPSEEAIKQTFAREFGTIKVIYSKDKHYVVFAHDRASGIIKEDIYIYRYQKDEWILIGIVYSSPLACSKIETNGNSIEVLDFKGQSIACFRQSEM